MRLTRTLGLGIAAAVVAGFTLTGAYARSSEGDQIPSPAAEEIPGDQLSDVAERYNHLLTLPGAGKAVLDSGSKSLRFYWAGEVPSELIDATRKDHGDVTIEVVPVKWSEKELITAQRRTYELAASEGFTVTSTEPTDGFDGIVVSVRPSDLKEAKTGTDDDVALRLSRTLEGQIGIPVVVQEGAESRLPMGATTVDSPR